MGASAGVADEMPGAPGPASEKEDATGPVRYRGLGLSRAWTPVTYRAAMAPMVSDLQVGNPKVSIRFSRDASTCQSLENRAGPQHKRPRFTDEYPLSLTF